MTASVADTFPSDDATAINAVGLDLIRHLAAERPAGNLVISPYSIRSALTLAYLGSDGVTRAEMAKALQFAGDDDAVQTAHVRLRTVLDRIAAESRRPRSRFPDWAAPRVLRGSTEPDRNQDREAIEWHAANRLFGQTGYPFRETFLARLREGFDAPLETLDFRTAPGAARDLINTWVEERTRRKIRDLIPPAGIGPDTRLALVNALYLKAPWDEPFKDYFTQPASFHLRDGSVANVPMMRRTGYLGYAREDGLTLVTLDYLGGELRFLVMLPETRESSGEIVARLKSDQLARWAKLGSSSESHYIALHLPKFTVKGESMALGRALRTLGITSAFDSAPGIANFERMAPFRPDDYLHFSEVYHQTFIAVDEQGTEAAAATAMVMRGGAAHIPTPLEVRVDRPFLFAIQHRESGACLFLGRIDDPR